MMKTQSFIYSYLAFSLHTLKTLKFYAKLSGRCKIRTV